MFLIIPISFMFILFCCNYEKYSLARIWSNAIIIWCILLFIHIETLSLVDNLSKVCIFIFWLLVCVAAMIYLLISGKNIVVLELLRNFKKRLLENKFFVVVYVILFTMAVLTIPYNWDSMTYHIPRVVQWAQNKSVAHYAVKDIRQVASPVLHEFICLDIYLLAKNRDFLFNCIQASAFITNSWLIYEISKKLGCAKRYSRMAALIFISTPIAFAEALTTQNDNLSCLFFLIFTYNAMDFLSINKKIEDDKETYKKCFVIAACVGFGYITKPTVSIGMLVMSIVVFVLCIVRHDKVKIVLRIASISVPTMLIIIAPEALRNIQTFGSILAHQTGARQLVGTLNPRYLFINGLKNYSFNLPAVYNANDLLKALVEKIADLINVDINAASISEDGRSFYVAPVNTLGHDTAVSPAVVIFFTAAVIWCLSRKEKNNKLAVAYTYLTMIMFVIICIFVRWEPFVSRYMLPYLALMSPSIAIWLEDMSKNSKNTLLRESCTVSVGCICIMGLALIFSYHGGIALKSLYVGRPDGYFINNSSIGSEYINACNLIKINGNKKIGLIWSGDRYEYPIWQMTKHDVEEIRHISVNNETSRYEDASYVPDCILATSDLGDEIEFNGNSYTLKYEGGGIICVYIMD